MVENLFAACVAEVLELPESARVVWQKHRWTSHQNHLLYGMSFCASGYLFAFATAGRLVFFGNSFSRVSAEAADHSLGMSSGDGA